MAEPEEDLLRKADALMARHRPARPGSEPYAEIPVLKDVVDLSIGADELPVLTEQVEVEHPHSAQSEVLAQSLRASLLAVSQPEIDIMVEERLKERLEPLVEKLFFDLRSELQLIARDQLNKAINTAVEREIEQRKSGG
jgi:hypothetical protein